MTLPFHPMNKEMVILISQGRYLSQQVGKDDISGEIFKLRILQKKKNDLNSSHCISYSTAALKK